MTFNLVLSCIDTRSLKASPIIFQILFRDTQDVIPSALTDLSRRAARVSIMFGLEQFCPLDLTLGKIVWQKFSIRPIGELFPIKTRAEGTRTLIHAAFAPRESRTDGHKPYLKIA